MAVESFPILNEMTGYAQNEAVPRKVEPGSWNEAIHHAVDRGELPPEACPVVTIDYMGPSLGTTVFAISSAVWLFAQHPEQWDLVREDPSLTPGVVSEVVRTDSPISSPGTSRGTVDGALLLRRPPQAGATAWPSAPAHTSVSA